MKEARVVEPFAEFWQIDVAELLIRRDGQLERGAFQVVDENLQIVRLNVGVLGRTPEEVVGMLDNELIERSGRRDEHGAGTPTASSCSTCALPRRSNRTRIARHHARVERSDIDAQFESASRYDAADSTVAQPTLDFAPLTGQIPAAIAANWLRVSGLRRIRLLQIRQQDLGVQTAVGEDNRLQLRAREILWRLAWPR